MSDSEECECEETECPAGIPAWVMTFADLMSLLMCFFVLLLAFSEMDIQKYKQVAGSMASAFGVQNQIKVKDIPKGTSIIAKEFSPGRPKPTPLNEVKQSTTDFTKSTLEVNCNAGTNKEGENNDKNKGSRESTDISTDKVQMQIAAAQKDAARLASNLEKQIQSGKIEVESRGKKIVIRVKENGSFPSGSATLRSEFIPIMDKIRSIIKDMPGRFYIEGHTDDIPINTPRFRSNWELSSSRAVSVAHELFKDNSIDKKRFTIVGMADTKPLVNKKTRKARSKNRRVEIIIEQGPEKKDEKVEVYDSEEVSKDSIEKRVQKELDKIDKAEIDNMIDEIEAKEAPAHFEFSDDEIF